jgi:hypothetical protein
MSASPVYFPVGTGGSIPVCNMLPGRVIFAANAGTKRKSGFDDRSWNVHGVLSEDVAGHCPSVGGTKAETAESEVAANCGLHGLCSVVDDYTLGHVYVFGIGENPCFV